MAKQGGTKFGSFTKRQLLRMRGPLGAKLRQQAGLTQGTAARPKDKPGEVADRAESGFARRMGEAANAAKRGDAQKQADGRERARRALEKYHASTVSAGKQAAAAQARVDAITAVIGPRELAQAGYSMKGGKLIKQTRTYRGRDGKVKTETISYRQGRDLAALRESFGSNWKLYPEAARLRREAAQAAKRHAELKKRYAKMYRQLTGKGGRSHQRKPPSADDI